MRLLTSAFRFTSNVSMANHRSTTANRQSINYQHRFGTRTDPRQRTLNVHSKCTITSSFNQVHSHPRMPQLLRSASAASALFGRKNVGLFNVPELADPFGFQVIKERALVDSRRLAREAISRDRHRKMVQVFDELSNALCRVADLCEFVKNGHPQAKFAIPAEEASAVISAEVERLNTNRALYDALRRVVDHGDVVATDAVDNHVNRLFLFDMEQSGIHLKEEDRQLVLNLNNAIFQYGQRFVQSTIKPVLVKSQHLPPEVRSHFHSNDAGGAVGSGGNEIEINGLYANADSELIREVAFKLYLTPNDAQQNNLVALLEARKTLAALCGFRSYAHRVLKGSIADTPDTVWRFLNVLAFKLRPLAERDYQQMLQMKRERLASQDGGMAAAGNGGAKGNGGAEIRLRPWDVQHYSALQRSRQQSQSLNASLPYFSIGACMHGLNLIIRRLYGCQFRVQSTEPGELWSPDVTKLGVYEVKEDDVGGQEDQGGRLLGHIYCDFFDRPGKPHQDCHFTIQGGCERADGTYQDPIVVLFLSLPTPNRNRPCLLNAAMVDNLFHEMGHAIHSMLARTKYQHITGTRCSTDLAEVPSILMEYFASDERVVRQFAKDYRTGQQIPDDLLQAWLRSKRVFLASELQLQVFYSVLDQIYHGEQPLQQDTLSSLKQAQNTYYGVKYVDGTAWHLRFGHLYGYGGKYYSYLMSRAIARLIWDRLFAQDPFCSESGHELRDKVLSHGGGKPPKGLVEDVLDTQINPELLADAILQDLV